MEITGEQWSRLRAAIVRATETYHSGPHNGAFIVAFDEFERLAELRRTLDAIEGEALGVTMGLVTGVSLLRRMTGVSVSVELIEELASEPEQSPKNKRLVSLE